MTKEARLLEILFEMIDAQIKKYSSLARMGVGPDAAMNAQLVSGIVSELSGFADELLIMLQQSLQGKPSDDDRFDALFHQIQFYINLGYIRAYAGWLLDSNHIHDTALQHLEGQTEQLSELAVTANIKKSDAFEPLTETQAQCRHDSHAIAFQILDMGLALKENPSLVFENENVLPEHALVIMRRNAKPGGRYHRDDILERMEIFHARHADFLEKSGREKSTDVLPREEAAMLREKDKSVLENQLNRFRKLQPESDIFSENYPWHCISLHPQGTKGDIKQTTRPSSCGLFGRSAAVAALGICALIVFATTRSDTQPLFSP